MTGKAISIQLLVAGNKLAWPDHQLWIDEDQGCKCDQVEGQNGLEYSAHDHPHNRKMLKI